MISGIHILLTYKCIYECDHCFVYSSPRAEGTFSFAQICKVLDESLRIGTIEWIYFEGGEPFLYYPLLIDGIKAATERGFKVGVVTNGYFAQNSEDAERWLMPLARMSVSDLSISDDNLHNDGKDDSPSKIALKAARKLGINVSPITINEPCEKISDDKRKKGEPVIGGDVMFKGRAAEKLNKDLPRVNCKEFTQCPYEDFVNPERVHVDAFGNVQLCQGISMGNMWQIPLAEIIKNYSVQSHPIYNCISTGGPLKLTEEFGIPHEDSYVDACHFCFEIRKKLIDKFPEQLAPGQVYGLG